MPTEQYHEPTDELSDKMRMFKHFGMDLEFLLRQKKEFRETLKGILFQPGDIVEHGEEAEDSVD